MLARRSRTPGSRKAKELLQWLDGKFEFTHFITLATNNSGLRRERLRDLLMEWDARVNRDVYGPKWRKHSDELFFAFAFLEKPKSNPHWHLLLRLTNMDPAIADEQSDRLDEVAELHWKRLIPSGSVVIKKITTSQDRVTDYVAKELGRELQYEDFVTPDEFRRL